MSTDFYQRNYLWVLLIFALGFPVAINGSIQAQKTNNNNVKQWLPDSPTTDRYDSFLRHFGSDEFAIVSWEGCTLDDPRVEQYAKLLEQRDHLFA
ncbi:MAG TPA: hypothetical protein VMX74_06940, partial [Pirellulales bacterium]|nr:hypothetical protein [Pirellulales bacterium]